MEIRHRINFFDTEILVHKKDDQSYQVSIVSASTPLAAGNVLETYLLEQTAKEAAERFSRVYSIAKENGYYLVENSFTKPDKHKIPVHELINSNASTEHIAAQFKG
jgi:hypothetical protein